MKKLERKIRRAVEHAAPDQLDSILSSCNQMKNVAGAWPDPQDAAGQKKGAFIHMSDTKCNKTRRTGLVAIAAMAAIFVLCFGVYRFFLPDTPVQASSVITMDVNPSLSLHVDAEERILAAEALNPDAKEVLGSMELEGTSLEVAVNAIIGSMLQKGYLGDLQNSILVSVEDKDADRGAMLQQKVSQTIADALEGGGLNPAILTQTIRTGDDALAELASQYQISLGKAALIQEVIRQAPELTFEALAPMTINEIALIASSRNVSSESVNQSGAASDKAYISQEEAQSKAYAHAGVTAEEIVRSKVEFDSDDGIMAYEVKFETAAVTYEYEIDARTGQVLEYESKEKGTGAVATTPQEQSSGNYIGQEDARNRAYAHAGIAAEDVLKVEVELDDKNGVMIYEVEFETGTVEFEYEIDALTGEILRHSAQDGHHHNDDEEENGHHAGGAGQESYIGESAALEAALRHAGVEVSSITEKSVELDTEDGKLVYEVEFEVGQMEYHYIVDPTTGSILYSHSEHD